MNCSICGAKTYVEKSFYKNDRVFRYRKCSNENCNHKMKTTEMESEQWRYRDIVKKMKELVNDVKI